MRRPPERSRRRLVVPVAEEEISVSKQQVVTGGVEVRVDVQTRPEPIELDLLRDDGEVRRVRVDREIDAPPPAQWWDGDELVLPILEERLVVVRRLFVREEVRLRRRTRTDRHREEIARRVEVATVRRYRRTDRPLNPIPKGKKP